MTREEAADRARDEALQEAADATAHQVGVQSPGYVQCEAGMHPDHGEATVFPPGQLLPDWVVAALAEQRPVPDEHGVYRLATKPAVKR
jgi:hypothetical protein